MLNLTTRTKSIIALIIVILLSLFLATYHGYYKLYLYEDEVLSYTLSNSRNGAYFNLRAGEWYDGSDLMAYTYVEKGQEFDWAQTIANQQMDTHPPIYALLLHAVCLLDAGDFSKWTGIGLNLFCYVIVFILLYLTYCELFPNRPYFAVFLCFVFGITAGVVALAVYIRMYILLMLFTTLCLLWHIRALKRQCLWHSYLSLSLMTFFGVMTHYFYLIFAFFCAAFVCIFYLFRKEWKAILWYVLSMITSAGLVLLTWNKVIWQLFTEEAAEDAFSQKLTPGVICSKILKMVRNTNEEIFGNSLKWIVLIIIIFAIYLLIKDRAKLKRAFTLKPALLLVVLVNVLFFLTVSVITPYLSTRYISPAFPFIIAMAVLTLEQVTNASLRSPVVGLVLIAVFFLRPEAASLREGLTDVNRQIIAEVSTEHAGELCMFGSNITPEENVFELRKFDKIYVYDGSNAGNVTQAVTDAPQIVVYVPENYDPDEYVANIRNVNPKLTELDRLYVAYYSTCYLLHE